MTACNLCGEHSDYAVHSIISTKRTSPHDQKCSEAVSFCSRCMQAICERDGCQVPRSLMQWLKSAHAVLTSQSGSHSDGSKTAMTEFGAGCRAPMKSGGPFRWLMRMNKSQEQIANPVLAGAARPRTQGRAVRRVACSLLARAGRMEEQPLLSLV